MANPRNDLPFPVHVTDHARERARERFPGFKAARIIDEVRAAFREAVLRLRPAWLRQPRTRDGFFAWTPDGERIYAMRTCYRYVAVVTVVRAADPGGR